MQNPLYLTLSDIKSMPQTTEYATLYCVDAPSTPIEQGSWTGVELSYLLQQANVSSYAVKVAFFAPDDFTFGQALERSALEAAVQAVPGVAGILCVEARVRGRSPTYAEMPDQIVVAADQIIRCVNDPSKPERGVLSVQVTGGR